MDWRVPRTGRPDRGDARPEGLEPSKPPPKGGVLPITPRPNGSDGHHNARRAAPGTHYPSRVKAGHRGRLKARRIPTNRPVSIFLLPRVAILRSRRLR